MKTNHYEVYSIMKDGVMKFSVPISSLSPRGLKNLFFSFYNKCELLSKATDGNFFVSKDFCYSIGDGVFKEQIIDKIIVQQEEKREEAQAEQGEHQGSEENKLQLLGIKIENRSDDYDGDLVFTGFNQSEEQEEQETVREQQEAVQEETAQRDTVQEDVGREKAAQEDTVQEDAAQEDAVQVADKPNFDPELENTPTVGTETAANNNAVEGQAGELAEEPASEASTQTSETPLLTIRDRAISAFLDYLVNHCNDVKHVALEDEETRIEAAKNEKFAMRAWFTQLGWRGKEDNELRSYFYDNLEGNTAFRTEEDHARWAAKWQPRYFDKHPEMKWVLEEVEVEKVEKERQAEELSEEIGELKEFEELEGLKEPEESEQFEQAEEYQKSADGTDGADSAYAAETAEAIENASAETAEAEMPQEGQEAPQETAQEAIGQTEVVETVVEPVAETEMSSEVEKEVEKTVSEVASKLIESSANTQNDR